MSNMRTTQSETIPVEASAALSSAVWTLDPAHTHIGFTVRHLGLTRTPGIFKRFSGQFAFDDLNIEASSGTFEVDAASIDTALDLRDEHLRGSEWFDVQAYPKIVFVSRAVRHIEGRQYVIDGDLTLRGITLPIAFNMTLIDRAVNPWTQAPVVGFEAVAGISRSAYGMSAFPGALSDEVRLAVSIELVRAEQN
ncbi:YceI family protein [Pseudomonas sp. JV551A1]|uniref:YceI family protein n=1 Tax=Pseudomonas inefficax TaxID=2078786 RepID=A0AAQ1PD38_9PSED|nr:MULTISPECIES: YceI family protein [Pseudomonas]SPO54627.1 YceI family protein [Pseudomonas sp. JV551A1]SPO62092.1 YceI family protein [Pseudomonas inefficax]